MTAWISAILGMGLLFVGGELLVRGAVVLARVLAVPPLVVGLTVVGFGTSAPEMVVSIGAALEGRPDVAMGNVVGSNIANILLILGTAALISPLVVSRRVFERDAMIMLAASLALAVLGASGMIERWAGVLLVSGLVAFLLTAYIMGRRDTAAAKAYADEAEEIADIPLPGWAAVLAVLGGFVALIYGAQLFVDGSVEIAQAAGLSDAVIGLTLIAVGTSLPELATSVIAAMRRHGDVAIGNVIGSNIFNILGILGVTSIVKPLNISDHMANIDILVMIAVAMVGMFMMRTGWRFSRLEGGVCLAAYAGYTTYLLAAA